MLRQRLASPRRIAAEPHPLIYDRGSSFETAWLRAWSALAVQRIDGNVLPEASDLLSAARVRSWLDLRQRPEVVELPRLDAPEELAHKKGPEFPFSRNPLNVAVSRAMLLRDTPPRRNCLQLRGLKLCWPRAQTHNQ